MVALLVGVFAFFWTHTALWFYRECKRAQGRQGREPHRRRTKLQPQPQGKHTSVSRRCGASRT